MGFAGIKKFCDMLRTGISEGIIMFYLLEGLRYPADYVELLLLYYYYYFGPPLWSTDTEVPGSIPGTARFF